MRWNEESQRGRRVMESFCRQENTLINITYVCLQYIHLHQDIRCLSSSRNKLTKEFFQKSLFFLNLPPLFCCQQIKVGQHHHQWIRFLSFPIGSLRDIQRTFYLICWIFWTHQHLKTALIDRRSIQEIFFLLICMGYVPASYSSNKSDLISTKASKNQNRYLF